MMTIPLSASFIAPEISDRRALKKLGTARWERRQLRRQLSDGKRCGVERAAGAQQGDQDGVQADQACRLVRGKNTQGMPALRPCDALSGLVGIVAGARLLR